jgi:hypothetical protein
MAQVHDELQAEGIVKEGRGVRMSGKMGFTGRVVLTNQRLVFLQANRLLMGFGLLGALFGQLMKPKNAAVSIPLSSITDVQRTKYAMNKNIMEISYGEGESARISVTPYEEWEQAVQSARAAAAPA